MRLEVKLFAQARELAGTDVAQIELPDRAVVADVRRTLADRFPQLQRIAPNLLVAVGTDYADDRTEIDAASEVACFPPVSGG